MSHGTMVKELYSKTGTALEKESLFHEVLVLVNLVPCLGALPCGHRPTWVDKYENVKLIRGPPNKLCIYVENSSWGQDQWFFL